MSVCDTCVHKGTSNCSDWEFIPPTGDCLDWDEAPSPKPTLADYVVELEEQLQRLENPDFFMSTEYYAKCRAQASLLTDVIRRLKEL
jgi:hypothetical protein